MLLSSLSFPVVVYPGWFPSHRFHVFNLIVLMHSPSHEGLSLEAMRLTSEQSIVATEGTFLIFDDTAET
jgi:hypothetical protein